MNVEQFGFKYLKPEDKDIFDEYYDKMQQPWASSISFTSMIAWNHSIKIYYKKINTFLVCLAWDISKKEWVCIPFLGEYKQNMINETFAEVKKLFETMNVSFMFTDISEWMKPYYEAIPDTEWTVINERGLCDYIYNADEFAAAMEKSKVRYDYNYFIKKYDPQLEIMTKAEKEQCKVFLKEVWCGEHTCEDCCYGCLLDTAENMFDTLEFKETNGIVVKSQGNIVSYCIVSCRNGQAIYQFKKTARGYRGINEYLHRECYERFLKDAEIINYTEDMDLEGLRKYKEKLAPYRLAPKYELQLKGRADQ